MKNYQFNLIMIVFAKIMTIILFMNNMQQLAYISLILMAALIVVTMNTILNHSEL